MHRFRPPWESHPLVSPRRPCSPAATAATAPQRKRERERERELRRVGARQLEVFHLGWSSRLGPFVRMDLVNLQFGDIHESRPVWLYVLE